MGARSTLPGFGPDSTTYSVTLGKPLNLSVPQFPRLLSKDKDKTYLTGLLWEFNYYKVYKVLRIVPGT